MNLNKVVSLLKRTLSLIECDYCGTSAFDESQMTELGGLLACPECVDTAEEMGLGDILL